MALLTKPVALLAVAGCALMPPQGETPEVGRTLDCELIALREGGGSPGPEDVAIDPAAQPPASLAFVSSTDRRADKGQQAPAARDGRIGHLYYVNLTKDPPQLEDATPKPFSDEEFEPHGISLHGTGENRRLFVINHRPLKSEMEAAGRTDAAHAVEVFRVAADGKLVHERPSIFGPEAMPNPNDLVATGPRSFYVTSMTASASAIGQTLEVIVGSRGFVAHYDGAGFARVAEGIPLANGIALDAASGNLFVASAADGLLRRFRIDPADPRRLIPMPSLATGTRLDNIEIDGGDLLVAGHPNAFAFLLHTIFPGWSAPTQILRITDPAGAAPRIAAVYTSDGIAAASTAAAYRDPRDQRIALLVGNVFGARTHRCRLPPAGT